MAASSKEEYLKKYLSVNAEEKRKKKKRKPGFVPAKIIKSRIVDDDVDFKSLLPENLANTLEEDVGDNDPIIADFVDERPEHVRLMEKYRSSGDWKVLGKDDERPDSDSDQSSPRRQRHDSDSDQSTHKRQRHDSDSDHSPVRKMSNKSGNKSVRSIRHDSDTSDSDQSPSRYNNKNDQSQSRILQHGSDSDQSPARRQRHDSDSDQSPPRRHKQKSDGDQSPARRQRHDSDSDQSPPRRHKQKSDGDQSPPRRWRHDSDSDQSPPRRHKQKSDSDQSPPRKKSSRQKDLSPPRRKTSKYNDNKSKSYRGKLDSDSDQSPPRRSSKHKPGTDGVKNGKKEKTLSGKRAGLSSALEMRREAEELKRKENEKFGQISDDRLGKGAATIFRDKSGRKRNLAEEKLKESEEAKKKAKEDEKFQKWGKGLKQIELQSKHVEEAIHEANKPLARYKDDDDLDQILRDMDRAEDPMLAFMTKKKSKNTGPPKKEKPRYKGPAPPPNRFGIMPGYRWDGVDRSSGFEKQVYAKQAERKAVSDQAYKWSVEDM